MKEGQIKSPINMITISATQAGMITAYGIKNNTTTNVKNGITRKSYYYSRNKLFLMIFQFSATIIVTALRLVNVINALTPAIQTSRTCIGKYKLLQTVPHDTNAYTQGLSVFNVFDKDKKSISVMLEGTGIYGRSELRHVNIETGEVIQRNQLRSQYYGEGITNYKYYEKRSVDDANTFSKANEPLLKQRIIQITWQEQKAFIYDVHTNYTKDDITSHLFSINPIYNFTFNTTTNEGWGITYRPDKHIFYVTDGSCNIHTWDATTFQEIHVQQVRQKKLIFNIDNNNILSKPMYELNEIQWDPVTNTILANVWYKNFIIRINPDTGYILTIYNLKKLYINRSLRCDSMNGIALTYNFEISKNNEIWVTGKLWPNRYRIQLID